MKGDILRSPIFFESIKRLGWKKTIDIRLTLILYRIQSLLRFRKCVECGKWVDYVEMSISSRRKQCRPCFEKELSTLEESEG